MIFQQLFEPESSTYTYLVACPDTRKAVLIDPVMEAIERDLDALQKLQLELAYTLDTHVHADHVTSACYMRSLTGSKIAHPAVNGLSCADVGVAEDQPLTAGALTFRALFTPGHTDSHHTYLVEQPGLLRARLPERGCARPLPIRHRKALHPAGGRPGLSRARLQSPPRQHGRAGARA